jgi:DNA-binding winged helix-turn-helix (wHTH) protein
VFGRENAGQAYALPQNADVMLREMPESSRLTVIRFAEYQADLRSGELIRQGHRLKLQEKPFQVLAALLTRPGELVTREELRQSLWPADTFVDFEHGLNTAVNKVREALRDSAANPRFIETLPRRGYRFIGEIDAEPGVTAEVQPTTATSSSSSSSDTGELPTAPRFASRTLLLLIELGYLFSYIAALSHLGWIRMVARFNLGPVNSLTTQSCVIVCCAMALPVRFYLSFALAFDYRLLNEKFRRLFPLLLLLDLVWSAMTFFLIPKIGLGPAFALFVAAVYSPFAQRTLVRMAYRPV